jgi:hypothetical protein
MLSAKASICSCLDADGADDPDVLFPMIAIERYLSRKFVMLYLVAMMSYYIFYRPPTSTYNHKKLSDID